MALVLNNQRSLTCHWMQRKKQIIYKRVSLCVSVHEHVVYKMITAFVLTKYFHILYISKRWLIKILVWFGLVLWYINHCKLFKSKSSLSLSIYIYIYIYIDVVPSISFQTFFLQAFKIVVDSWKFSMLYILWDDWPIFMISASNAQLQQELEYTLLKPNCHSWWISKT